MADSNNTVDILFRTRLERQGAEQFAAELERQIGKAKAMGKDVAELETQLNKVRKAIEHSPKPSGPGFKEVFDQIRDGMGDVIPGFAKLDSVISKFGGGALAAIGGGFAAIAAGLEGAKHSLEEYAQAQEQVAKLDAALGQRGLLTSQYREEVQELASELQKATAIADDQWIAVLTRLTQFGADPENIHEYAEAVKNLAGIMGGDIQSAATLLSRAMQGNYEMFSRYGITVEEGATQTEKLNKLFEQLALRGGGQLEGAAKTINGQFRDLKNNANDLWEAFGRGIARSGALQAGLGLLSDFFESWAEIIGGPVDAIEGIGNAAVSTKQAIESSVPSDAYTKALKGIEEAANNATTKLNGLRAAALEEFNQQEKLAQARKDHDIASIDMAVAKGEISKVEGDRRKGLIEAGSIKDSAERQRKILEANDFFDAAELNQKLYAAHVAQGSLGVQKSTNSKADELADTRKALGKYQADYQNDLNEKKRLEEILSFPGVGAATGALGVLPGIGPLLGGLGVAGEHITRGQLQEKLNTVNQRLPARQKLAEDAQAKLEGLGTEEKARTDRLKSLQDAADKTAAEARQAQLEYDAKHKVTGIKKAGLEAVTGEQLGTQSTKTETQIFEDKQQQLEQKVKDVGKGFTTAIERNTDATVSVVQAATDKIEEQNATLDDLLQRVGLLESRTANLRV